MSEIDTSRKVALHDLNEQEETIIDDPKGYTIRKISPVARLIEEFTSQAKKKNVIWSTTIVDVTDAVNKIKAFKERTGESVSFTAYIITVFAHVVARHKYPFNSMLKKKKEVYTFDDVDVSTNIERTLPDGMKKPVSYTIRQAHKKNLLEISRELREAQKAKEVSASTAKRKGIAKFIGANIHRFPKPLRTFFLNKLINDPMFKKNSMGTVNVTAVGMFGSGTGHMIHITSHTVSLGVGGMQSLPYNNNGKVENREVLALTLAMDHSVIDGGPAARFYHDLRQWIEHFSHEADWCFKSLDEV